jgi:hypothetical protein
MCSNVVPRREPEDDLAGRLSAVIDELAAAAGAGERPANDDLTARLAAIWALIAEADPELAERTAKYSR